MKPPLFYLFLPCCDSIWLYLVMLPGYRFRDSHI